MYKSAKKQSDAPNTCHEANMSLSMSDLTANIKVSTDAAPVFSARLSQNLAVVDALATKASE
jgi:hypothetical protein